MKYEDNRHEYINDYGQKYISVTQLLNKMGFATDYSMVDPDVLKKAKARGEKIHEEIELALGGNYDCEYTKGIIPRAWQFKNCEQIVSDDKLQIAGRYDVLMQNGNESILIDIKITNMVNREYTSWQLAIYRLLAGLSESTPLYCLHISKDGKSQLIQMQKHSDDEVKRLVRCFHTGAEFAPDEPQLVITNSELNLIRTADELAEKIKATEQELKIVKQKILKQMKEQGLKSCTFNDWNFTIVAGAEKTIVDSARLKAEMPSIYDEFSKKTKVAESLRILNKKK